MIRRSFLGRIAGGLVGLVCWPLIGTRPKQNTEPGPRRRLVEWSNELVMDARGRTVEWRITRERSDGTCEVVTTDDAEEVKLEWEWAIGAMG